MRGRDREVVPVRSDKVERVVYAAPADLGGPQAFSRVVAPGSLDIVHHQVEGCRGPGDRRLLRPPDDDMRAAAEFENCEIGILKDRAQADGFEPPRRRGDIGCRKANMADRYQRLLVECLRHDFPLLELIPACSGREYLEQVPVGIAEVKPATAIAMIDLHVLRRPRPATISKPVA